MVTCFGTSLEKFRTNLEVFLVFGLQQDLLSLLGVATHFFIGENNFGNFLAAEFTQ